MGMCVSALPNELNSQSRGTTFRPHNNPKKLKLDKKSFRGDAFKHLPTLLFPKRPSQYDTLYFFPGIK